MSLAFYMRTATSTDDVLLEIIVLLGTVAACDQAGAQLLCDEALVELMIELLSGNSEVHHHTVHYSGIRIMTCSKTRRR